MRTMIAALPLTLLLAGTTLPAAAQTAASPAPAQRTPALFNQADANHDGRVSWDEAWNLIQQRFTAADKDHDGSLTMQEWEQARPPGRPLRAGRPAGPEHIAERRAALFRALDANRDGKVTPEEIRPVAEAWFRAFDANGDGAVAREELPHWRGGSRG